MVPAGVDRIMELQEPTLIPSISKFDRAGERPAGNLTMTRHATTSQQPGWLDFGDKDEQSDRIYFDLDGGCMQPASKSDSGGWMFLVHGVTLKNLSR